MNVAYWYFLFIDVDYKNDSNDKYIWRKFGKNLVYGREDYKNRLSNLISLCEGYLKFGICLYLTSAIYVINWSFVLSYWLMTLLIKIIANHGIGNLDVPTSQIQGGNMKGGKLNIVL